MLSSERSSSAAAVWNTIAAEVRTMKGRPSSTIGRVDEGALDGGLLADPGEDSAPLEMGEVLGRGGMGVVQLAHQRSVGRAVAVKSLRSECRRPKTVRKLLQEAWITGRLEHPNIVPVYDIVSEGDGVPLIVLKRIEGVSWAQFNEDPEKNGYLVDGVDALDRNLSVLIEVCQAISFAHSHDILHLDVKPDNVMLGRYGEVYVVDWGVALALNGDETGRLPVVADHHGIVGTPHYIAPEMLEGDGRRLGPRTDVYLLGATLFELLAGRPPHRGDTIMEVFHAALMEEPSLPAGVPEELAVICCKAMARDPAERYPSAEVLRSALKDFVLHRGSLRIAEQAAARLSELEEWESSSENGKARHQVIFGQARFGFEQALASWPENEFARGGLTRAFEVMVRFELEHGDPHVSAALAQEAPALPPELREQVGRAVSQREAGLDELVVHRRDQDLRIGQRTRMFAFCLMALLWTAISINEHFVAPSRTVDDVYAMAVAIPAGSLIVLAVLFVWGREQFTRTRANRVAVTSVALAMVAQLLLGIGCVELDLGREAPIALVSMVWSILSAMVAVTVERRAFVVSGGFLLAFIASISWPEGRYLFLVSADLVLFFTVALAWWPERLLGPTSDPRDRRTRSSPGG